ncbi:MAG: hypothetical protein ACK46A_14485 [Akkermansiaceae bacterium]|jgi:hypothetical protein
MKQKTILKFAHSIALTISVISLFPGLVSAEEPVAKAKDTVVWQNDEMCQFVFFAVLEGLYRDGIDNNVVDAILGDMRKGKDDDSKLKSHFVFRCELCHATYEAFRAYRERPTFLQSGGKSTFGEGKTDAKIVAELRSENASTRVYAMGSLVRPWILHRIEETRKTDEEKKQMKERFEKFAKEGGKLLGNLRETDELYLDWQFYGSCQACEAAEDLGK